MTQTIIEISALRKLASQHAMSVVAAQERNASGDECHRELLEEFRLSRQPFLSDKQYTALYQTYTDLVMTAIENHYSPGSRVARPPVKVSDVRDGAEIYRPNAVPMSTNQWNAYIAEVEQMAERFAREVAALAGAGGDVKQRMEEQQFEAARFSLDHGLNEDESRREAIAYKEAFTRELDREVELRRHLR